MAVAWLHCSSPPRGLNRSFRLRRAFARLFFCPRRRTKLASAAARCRRAGASAYLRMTIVMQSLPPSVPCSHPFPESRRGGRRATYAPPRRRRRRRLRRRNNTFPPWLPLGGLLAGAFRPSLAPQRPPTTFTAPCCLLGALLARVVQEWAERRQGSIKNTISFLILFGVPRPVLLAL